ncbi:Ubiquitin carboxyl-terminal hydrolase 45 [Gonapodya sp. JEL0774]|nr:Ubiquitin carboxyl-terminal hydrolase 45 [Gonapodya sp. JEL0774]
MAKKRVKRATNNKKEEGEKNETEEVAMEVEKEIEDLGRREAAHRERDGHDIAININDSGECFCYACDETLEATMSHNQIVLDCRAMVNDVLTPKRLGQVDPTTLLRALAARHKEYRALRQQDAHEALRRLLDASSEEEKKARRAVEALAVHEGGGPEAGVDLTVSKTPIQSAVDSVFGVGVVSVVVCDVCKTISSTSSAELDIFLPIVKRNGEMVGLKPGALENPWNKKRRKAAEHSREGLHPDSNAAGSSFSGCGIDVSCVSPEAAADEMYGAYSHYAPINLPPRAPQQHPPPVENSRNVAPPDPAHLRRVALLTRVVSCRSSSNPAIQPANLEDVSLSGCLERFLATERLEGSDGYACEACWKAQYPEWQKEEDGPVRGVPNGKILDAAPESISRDSDVEKTGTWAAPTSKKPPPILRSATKRLLLLDPAPEVLVVGLKRFQTLWTGRTSKIQEWVEFPERLDLEGCFVAEAELAGSAATRDVMGAKVGAGAQMGPKKANATALKVSGMVNGVHPFPDSDGESDTQEAPPAAETRAHVVASTEDETKETKRIVQTEIGLASPSKKKRKKKKKTGVTQPKPVYRLYGVVVHSGSTLGLGHYVAYVRARLPHEPKEQFGTEKANVTSAGEEEEKGVEERWGWIYASDHMTRESSWEEVRMAQAFLLFYERE